MVIGGIGLIAAATLAVVVAGQPVAQDATATPPQPLPTDSFMTDDDYPADARKAGQQGTAHISLDVNEKGKATGCSIVQTSRVQSLDQASCRVFSQLKFKPARDGEGQRVAGVFVTKLRWALPRAGN